MIDQFPISLGIIISLESINRCGECHRRVDEFTTDELVPTNPLLIRFSPVGLALSRCFQETNKDVADAGGKRLDCVTCHDPHDPPIRETEKLISYFRDKCLQCHEDQACGKPRRQRVAANDNDCSKCHMPRGETNVSHFALHDHRIGDAQQPRRGMVLRALKRSVVGRKPLV